MDRRAADAYAPSSLVVLGRSVVVAGCEVARDLGRRSSASIRSA